MTKYRLKGHESFFPREGWITKGLDAVHSNAKVFSVASGADALGVGTNMAKSIRYWMRTAGLISENSFYGASLTELGKLIYENDPYFEDLFSSWILHINIATNFAQATSWNVFFNRFNVSTFKRDELNSLMMEMLLEETKEETLPERSVKDDCSAILFMYSDERNDQKDPEDKMVSPFKELGLLHKSGTTYEKQRPDNDLIDPLVILYMLNGAFLLEEGERKSIQIDSIIEEDNMPGKILNLNRIMVNDYLDRLHEDGFLIVNRTAGLDVVYKNHDLSDEEIIEHYYRKKGNV